MQGCLYYTLSPCKVQGRTNVKPNFTMPNASAGQPPLVVALPSGNALYVLVAILAAGIVTCFAAVCAAIFGAALLLNLAISAIVELVAHVASVYVQADSLTKVVIWLVVGLLLWKVVPALLRWKEEARHG